MPVRKKSKKEKKSYPEHRDSFFQTWGDSFHMSVSPHVVNLQTRQAAQKLKITHISSRGSVEIQRQTPKLNLAQSLPHARGRWFKKFFKWQSKNTRHTIRVTGIYRAQRTLLGSLIAFILVSLSMVVPMKAISYLEHAQSTKTGLENSTQQAIKLLNGAFHALWDGNFSLAKETFIQSDWQFQNLIGTFEEEENVITFFLEEVGMKKGQAIALARDLFMSGHNASVIGEQVSRYFLGEMPDSESLETTITEFFDGAQSVLSTLNAIEKDQLPVSVSAWYTPLSLVRNNIPTFRTLTSLAASIFFNTSEQRYLIFFQNSNEIRPTGGFLGAFAVVVLEKGIVKNIEIPPGGTYDLQGQLTQRLISPEPLHYINPRWECQDTNWYFDFPTSARRMASCYENARGETIDGVMSVNENLLSGVLNITGPISLDQYRVVLDTDTVISTIQYSTENQYGSKDMAPKQIIADLSKELIKKISEFSVEQKTALIRLLLVGLNQKDIQIYFKDSQLQRAIWKLGWSGRIQYTDGDYLAVVHTNIGGGKSDEFIDEQIVHSSTVQNDGAIENEIRLTRQHNGSLDNILSNVVNKDFVRFYVPFGSVFLSAEGFDIPDPMFLETPDASLEFDAQLIRIEGHKWSDPLSRTSINDEFGKTVFANWVILAPGERKTVVVRYRLPQRLVFGKSSQDFFSMIFGNHEPSLGTYSLYFQKQSGMKNQTLSKLMTYPNTFKIAVNYPVLRTKDGTSIVYGDLISSTDQFLFSVFQR